MFPLNKMPKRSFAGDFYATPAMVPLSGLYGMMQTHYVGVFRVVYGVAEGNP